MKTDANKAMAYLGNSISQYAIQNAILQSKVESMQSEIDDLKKKLKENGKKGYKD